MAIAVDQSEAVHSAVPAHPPGHGLFALMVGAVGVVFGDIGTSPLYAMREALSHVRGGAAEPAVLGVVSLIVWALILIVTVKYVIFVLRADNRGEGGTLALMALAQRAIGYRSVFIFVLGVFGAALFYGDGVITPAISVLSAVEGLRDAPGLGHAVDPFVLPGAAAVLVALFLVQSRGTAHVGALFGPIMVVWFLAIAGLGLMHVLQNPAVLLALSPHWGVRLLLENGVLGFVILGSVFLAVTGAEALYADIGHFGKDPIRIAWLVLAFPCLVLNYLGQGAAVLADPTAQANPFFRMIPEVAYWPMLLLATAATVIASQAVITGAFSVTQQAVQLGLLPRVNIKRTSETVAGQIFVPQVNVFLMVGVLFLLMTFRTSSAMASAYGIAVTATMVITVLLLFVIARHCWKWPRVGALALVAPLLALDLTFLGANSLKIHEGGWFPLALGGGLVLVMWTWSKGTRILAIRTRRDSLPLADLIASLAVRPPHRVGGTAVFLTSDPTVAPVALMHNLKHNKVLHEKNVILTVVVSDAPRVPEADRVAIEPLTADFKRVKLTYGFMEDANVPKALSLCRRRGLKFDIMSTSFFLGRRSVVASAKEGMPSWQDKLFIFLMKNAANPTDFYRIPPGRVVEMGTQVTM